MKHSYSQSVGIRWLPISIWTVIIIIVSCCIFGIYLYQDIYDKKTMGFEETADTIINQTAIVDIDNIELFHGEDAYHIVYGTTADGEGRIIFYPLEGAEKDILSVSNSEIISKDEILQNWKSECSNCTFVKISPAVIKDNIYWEVTYHDNNARYVIDYMSIYDGSLDEQYRFERMFN
ncbi:DUF5590 domain-containing protein [Oceanobacillus bengalensis]|uniref:Cell wall elongation regulator TseB-like domain-containing protein n=2 Tax=Oceanobacillus bengalensis TaxID=1435466 RepID=A0A494YUU4_9BACI|nr:hypothetical protein D8M05_14695 [Oceanobacillus bengalensis]